MITMQPLVTEFTMTGKLEDFIISSGDRLKYLQLSTAEGEYWLKVAKEKKSLVHQHLQVGCWLKVTGMQKHKIHQEEVEYKAYRIELLQQPCPTNFQGNKPNAKVLFCQKSTCWQRGGKTACQLLKTELQNKGIEDRVEIKTTGCLKKCQQAPNMILLPEKVHYARVQPQQILSLVETVLQQ